MMIVVAGERWHLESLKVGGFGSAIKPRLWQRPGPHLLEQQFQSLLEAHACLCDAGARCIHLRTVNACQD